MTDPAPSPDATPRPVPVRPMPRLGHGIVWADITADIDRDHAKRLTEFKETAEDLNSVPESSSQPVRTLPTPEPEVYIPGSQPGPARHVILGDIRAVAHQATLRAIEAEADQIYTRLFEQTGDTPYLAPALEAAATGGSETGGNEKPSGGPPYTHRYVPSNEDEPPAPSYTYTSPSRRARWLRALDRIRRSHRRASLYIAGRAHDRDDARLLLEALGLIDSGRRWKASIHTRRRKAVSDG